MARYVFLAGGLILQGVAALITPVFHGLMWILQNPEAASPGRIGAGLLLGVLGFALSMVGLYHEGKSLVVQLTDQGQGPWDIPILHPGLSVGILAAGFAGSLWLLSLIGKWVVLMALLAGGVVAYMGANNSSGRRDRD
jgi:hypothetical protein